MIIISGGQSGVDIAALEWAKENGFRTGGLMSKGFKTEFGPKPEYYEIYKLKCMNSPGYMARTIANLRGSDYTLIFGDLSSSGSRMTIKNCRKYNKNFTAIDTKKSHLPLYSTELKFCAKSLAINLKSLNVKILNVAGNRESVNPGIGIKLKEFLTLVFDHKDKNDL